MKSKLAILKQVENLDINLTLVENMFSRQYTVEQYLEQVRRMRERIAQIKGLLERESEEFA